MSFTVKRRMPSVEEVLAIQPLPPDVASVKKTRDSELQQIFEGRDNRFIVIIGPCSAHDETAVCDYVSRLAKLQEQVAEKLFLVPRIYTNKPRTTGTGYKGMLHQPDPNRDPDMVEGLRAIRSMHIRALSESGLAAADEMLYPDNAAYLADVLGYVAVGARSVENQQHRLVASGFDVPVGMKNPTSGDVSIMMNSIAAAQAAHTFIYNTNEVETPGNHLTHAIMRGAVNHFGQAIPNYHYEDLSHLVKLFSDRALKNPGVVVDANHANSNKRYSEQPRIVMDVLDHRRYSPELKQLVKGVMVESFIVEGAQQADGNVYGQSITDPCIGWGITEKLILDMADRC